MPKRVGVQAGKVQRQAIVITEPIVPNGYYSYLTNMCGSHVWRFGLTERKSDIDKGTTGSGE